MTSRATPRAPTNADYDALFELTATPTLEVDAAGLLRRVNGAACRLLGQGPDQLRGRGLDDVLGVDLTPALATSRATDLEAILEDGPTLLRMWSLPRELHGAGNHLYTVQLIRREGREAVDTDRRAEASRLSLLDDVSHNLGTPLAIVAGYAETLADRWQDLTPEDVAKATSAISRHAQRAVEELRALQARVRLTGTGAGTVPTSVLFAWLRRMLSGPLAANGTVLVGESDHDQVTIDVTLTRQVLLNVCQLALAADPRPVTVTLALAVDGRGTRFTVTSDPAPTGPLDVTDTVRATEALVAGAGGRYESPSATDAHHVLWLPDTSVASHAAHERIPVAVIEDDPDTAALIRASLHASSAVFDLVADERTFTDGFAAVRLLRPRILLLDQGLPDRLGTDGVAELQDEVPGMTIVLLSAHDRRRFELPPEVERRVVWFEKGRVLADLGTELISVIARES